MQTRSSNVSNINISNKQCPCRRNATREKRLHNDWQQCQQPNHSNPDGFIKLQDTMSTTSSD